MAPEEIDHLDAWGDLTDDVLTSGLEHFGEPAEYQPAGEEPQPLPSGGIFRESHQEVSPTTGAAVSTQQPTLDVRFAELPIEESRNDGDRILVRGRTFRIEDVEKDGEVAAKIFLREVVA